MTSLHIDEASGRDRSRFLSTANVRRFGTETSRLDEMASNALSEISRVCRCSNTPLLVINVPTSLLFDALTCTMLLRAPNGMLVNLLPDTLSFLSLVKLAIVLGMVSSWFELRSSTSRFVNCPIFSNSVPARALLASLSSFKFLIWQMTSRASIDSLFLDKFNAWSFPSRLNPIGISES